MRQDRIALGIRRDRDEQRVAVREIGRDGGSAAFGPKARMVKPVSAAMRRAASSSVTVPRIVLTRPRAASAKRRPVKPSPKTKRFMGRVSGRPGPPSSRAGDYSATACVTCTGPASRRIDSAAAAARRA